MVVNRAEIEHLVRRAVYARLNRAPPKAARAPKPLVVNVSARHCHLTAAAVGALFGPGHVLSPARPLFQKGQFAAEETVTLIGPKRRVISNLRILGPCRSDCQVELAYTDAISLGFEIPTRLSGDLEGTPGCMLMGPKGFFEMDHGVIRAVRHVHMNEEDAAFYGVEHESTLRLKVGGDCPAVLERVVVRVGRDYALEVHLDTDEANACNLRPGTPCELLR
ncbi:MAG TPA: phosphate propanoyltransferase [Anaeromyxobacteraceae bacterium]|nr:phosphate propanoyltransferase [Anaeromyxobacteraceae bacterium]